MTQQATLLGLLTARLHPRILALVRVLVAMNDDPFDFSYLLDFDTTQLLRELATVHGELARLHEEIALVRAAEANKDLTSKSQRINDEGHRDALIEKKFLIVRLLDLSS